MPITETAPSKVRKEIYTGQQTAPVTYANHCLVAGSTFDVRLCFGVIEDADHNTITIRHVQNIYMRPETALNLAATIFKQLGITLPDEAKAL